jgi:phenylacetate-coenzyme A ligase PaaK-like adenylate-forming protein
MDLTTIQLHLDLWRAGQGSPDGLARRQRARLQSLLAFARTHSPFYRQLYRELPANADDLRRFPPVTKTQLMAAFDDVVTDRAITYAEARRFVANPDQIGRPYRERYRVWSSSGVTGEPGLVVLDEAALAVYRASSLIRGWLPWMTPRRLAAVLLKLDRVASVVATGGHYPSAGMLIHHRQHRPWPFNRLRLFPIQLPRAELVRQLNAFQPAELVGYATALAILAEEQRAGQLAIRPALVGSGGEWLSPRNRALIEAAFGCPVRDGYGACEFTRLVWGCQHGRLHVSSDWVILEPVNEHYTPVPPGVVSHTSLVTNLANRVMPFIRYEVGDRIMLHPDPCRCGSPLPTIEVEGRRDDILRIADGQGGTVSLPPLLLYEALQEAPGVRRYQVIQTQPAVLTVRLETEPGAEPDPIWAAVQERLGALLRAQGLPRVHIEQSAEPVAPDPSNGKFRHTWSELPTPPEPAGS